MSNEQKDITEEYERLKQKLIGSDNHIVFLNGKIQRLELDNERLAGKEMAARQSLERVTEILSRELKR
jgi:hypothetical protein